MLEKEIKITQMPLVLLLQNYCNFDYKECNKRLFDSTIRKSKAVIYVDNIIDQQDLFVYINEKFGLGLQHTFVRQVFDNNDLFYFKSDTKDEVRTHLNNIINKTSFNVDVLNPLRNIIEYFILIITPTFVVPVIKYVFDSVTLMNDVIILYEICPRDSFVSIYDNKRYFNIKNHISSVRTNYPVFDIIESSSIVRVKVDEELIERPYTYVCDDGYSTRDKIKRTYVNNYNLILNGGETIYLDELNYLDIVHYLHSQ